jgi:phosphoglycerol transferase MdoB-like AlkP superfamily enzyme
MQGILYEEPSAWLFLLVTMVMGGWLAWMTGRAIALTWKPQYQLVIYVLVLGLVVRFIHFALFHATLLTLHFYIVDTVILMAFAFAGWRYNRARQMTTQYRWLFERSGPFGWKPREGAAIKAGIA